MPRIIDPFSQFFDDEGNPLVNGFLQFYESGTNNTDKDTFADINEEIANANPVPLSGSGRCPNVFGTGAYNIISFADSIITPGTPGEQIQQFDPVIAGQVEGAFAEWNAVTLYAEGDIVTGPDGLYYKSIVAGNQNQDPTANPDKWKEIQFLDVWNTNVTYEINDIVVRSGSLYASLTASNLGNDPASDTTNWGTIVGDGSITFEKIGSDISTNSISGLTLSNNTTDSDHDIDISTGNARDSTDAYTLVLDSVLVKQIDAAWAVGTDAGGMFTGSVAIDTWYHLFLIRKDSDGSIDAGFDTSVTAANSPAGYTAYRRIGSILTDGSANIIGFNQVGRVFVFNDQSLDISDTTPGTSANLATLSTPLGIEVKAMCIAALAHSTTVQILITSLSQTDTAPSITNLSLRIDASGTNAVIALEIMTDVSSQIRYRSSLGTVSLFQIYTRGWIDNRGEN